MQVKLVTYKNRGDMKYIMESSTSHPDTHAYIPKLPYMQMIKSTSGCLLYEGTPFSSFCQFLSKTVDNKTMFLWFRNMVKTEIRQDEQQ